MGRAVEPLVSHPRNECDVLRANFLESRCLSPGQTTQVSLMIQNAFQELRDCVQELKTMQGKLDGEQEALMTKKLEQVLGEQDAQVASKLKMLEDCHKENLLFDKEEQSKVLRDTDRQLRVYIDENRAALERRLDKVAEAVSGLGANVASHNAKVRAELDGVDVGMKGHIDRQVNKKMEESKKDFRYLWERLQRNEQTVKQLVDIIEEVAGWGSEYVKSVLPSQIHSIKTYFQSSAITPSFLSFLKGTLPERSGQNAPDIGRAVPLQNRGKSKEAGTATTTTEPCQQEQDVNDSILPRRNCRGASAKRARGQPKKRSRTCDVESSKKKTKVSPEKNRTGTPSKDVTPPYKPALSELDFSYSVQMMSPNTPMATRSTSAQIHKTLVTPFDSKQKAVAEKENVAPSTRSAKKKTRSRARKGLRSFRAPLFQDDSVFRFATNS